MKSVAVITLIVSLGSAVLGAEDVAAGLPQRLGGVPSDYDRIRRALQRERRLVIPPDVAKGAANTRQNQAGSPVRSDTVWEGLLIGAAIGGVGGYIWARSLCGSDDTECFVITGPVGILGGVGIGALVGAVTDKLHK